MPTVNVRKNEPFENALKRLKRTVDRAKRRINRFYEKPSKLRAREAAAAQGRHRKKLQREGQFAKQVIMQQRREWE